jgi:hypothetical protein
LALVIRMETGSSRSSPADVTAITLFQATMAVPGRVIPNDPVVEQAIRLGERRFLDIGCATCHVPRLPLDRKGWVFAEPNEYNPAGNRQPGDGPVVAVDLTSPHLPSPRLRPEGNVVWVPAFTDFKLHDICDGPDDPTSSRSTCTPPPDLRNSSPGTVAS